VYETQTDQLGEAFKNEFTKLVNKRNAQGADYVSTYVNSGYRQSMIKKLGTLARKDIETFLDSKVFLELFVKVRAKWRDNDTFLREYGY
jgi:hypothetical protein